MADEDFERFFRNCFARVARTAYLITSDRQEAIDLAQEGFARAYARWRSVSNAQSPEAWVQRVVANLAISARRRRAHLGRLPVPPEGAVEPPVAHVELIEALRSLSPSQRAVIVLRFYGDWSVEDVARALHKRSGTVRALTSQGLARLRKQLHLEEETEHEARR